MVVTGKHILVVDDEEGMRDLLSIVLHKLGCSVHTAPSGEEGLNLFKRQPMDLIIQDIRMPGMGGLKFLEAIRALNRTVPILVITAFSTWDIAVKAMQLGANDYVRKPFSTDDIASGVKRLIEEYDRQVAGQNETLIEKGGFVLGTSRKQRSLYEQIKQVAPTDSTVLIRGESGTGKELVARMIHSCSGRAAHPFISVNCSAFPETLLESELFGYKRGAFTGAHADKLGLMELAGDGTLFLDEIAEMTYTVQAKLLRVLEERKLMALGDTRERRFNARIIAATNKDLENYIQEHQFREDLYFRLNVIPIHLSPLRERKEDIPLLSGHFLAKHAKHMGKQIEGISENAKELLLHYDWPGNIRELENIIQRYVAMATGPLIDHISLAPMAETAPENGPAPQVSGVTGGDVAIPPEGMDIECFLEDLERRYILEALRVSDGNMTRAAKLLNLNYRAIRYKVKKLNLKPQEPSPQAPS